MNEPAARCALTADGQWRAANERFLVPVVPLAVGVRGRFLAKLEASVKRGEISLSSELAQSPSRYLTWLDGLRAKRWMAYAKRPFAGPDHVLRCVARHTHRVALSNGRLVALDGDDVVDRYKSYREDGAWKSGRMDGVEFVRRFTQHILTRGFVRIRYYGILSNRRRREAVASCRDQLGEPEVEGAVDVLWPDGVAEDSGRAPAAPSARSVGSHHCGSSRRSRAGR